MAAVPDTLLVLSVMGVPLYSARGLTQLLVLIPAASQIEDSINGEAIDFSVPQFRKYSSEITCSDQRPPAFGSIYPGQEIEVECACELAYPITGIPDREVVAGSERIEGEFVAYRPKLHMVIRDMKGEFAEWEAGYRWSLSLVEKRVPTITDHHHV